MNSGRGDFVFASGTQLLWSLAAVMVCALPLIGLGFQQLFFRDYAIVYEGAWRVAHGQVPYQDFTMPLGPVTLWLPAWAMEHFGTGWEVQQKLQVWLHVVSTAMFLALARNLTFPWAISLVATAVYALCYALAGSLPWYNTTAIWWSMMAFMLVGFQLRLGEGKHLAMRLALTMLATLAATLSFYSKQDAGGLTLIGLAGFLVVSYWSVKGHKGILWWHLAALVMTVAIATVLLNQHYGGQMLAYLNLGQSGQDVRLSPSRFLRVWLVNNSAQSWSLLATVGTVILASKADSRSQLSQFFPQLFIIMWVSAMAWITRATSGIPSSHDYLWPFLVLWVYLLVHLPFHGGRLRLLGYALPLILLVNVVQDIRSSLRGPKLSFEWNKGWLEGNPLLGNVPEQFAPLSGGGFQGLHGTPRLQTVLDSLPGIFAKADSSQPWLNMSELSPACTALPFRKPAVGIPLPLWYDVFATIGPAQKDSLARAFVEKRYALVVWQQAHSALPQDHWYQHLEHGYVKVYDGLAAHEHAPLEVWLRKEKEF